ncbi:type II toxin-antitoxin system death-on-curing family toxin [Bounagaea algeriensis]
MTEHLDVADVLEVTRVVLGEPPQVRDYGLLESAVARPQASLFGADAYTGVHVKAAALLHSLACNHALVDGNERAAWNCSLVFLDLSGHSLIDPLESEDVEVAEEMVCAAAQNQVGLEHIAAVLGKLTAHAESGGG